MNSIIEKLIGLLDKNFAKKCIFKVVHGLMDERQNTVKLVNEERKMAEAEKMESARSI